MSYAKISISIFCLIGFKCQVQYEHMAINIVLKNYVRAILLINKD